MKLTEFLIVTCCSIITARSENSDTDQELLKRASEQLERLAPYQRSADQEALDLANLLETWRPLEDQDVSNGKKIDGDQSVPWELLEILPEQTGEVAKRADEKKRITIDIITDPKYAAMMQERIKRGFNAGSASLLTSIAGGVLSGVASASSGSAAKASASSSQHDYKPAYSAPPVYSYEEKPFGAWDFKKAIFSTVFQALKAIGGGVLALKGQLVKGGGYLLAAKGKVISKTGDVITSFGKHLTSSVATYPASYPPDTYTYEQHPPAQDIAGHDYQASAPGPDGPDGYSEANYYPPHSAYGVPSDDKNQGGLLIVTPTKSDLDEHSDQHVNLAEPDPTKLEESFGGPVKAIKDFLISVPNGSGNVAGTTDHQAVVAQDDHDNNINVNSYASPPIAHPVPIYGAPEHYSSHHDNPTQTYENYPAVDQEHVHHHLHHPEPVIPLTPSSHHFPNLADPHLSIQPSVEYPPLHVQQLDYPHGGLHGDLHNGLHNGLHGALTSPLLKPVPKLPLHDDGGTSVYASITVDTQPQLASLKVPLLGYPGALDDLPKLQPHVDFHGQPQFANLHNNLDGPLRIHLLNPLPPYWQDQGSLAPASAFGTLNSFHKRNVLQRRSLASRFARYASLQATRLHRL